MLAEAQSRAPGEAISEAGRLSPWLALPLLSEMVKAKRERGSRGAWPGAQGQGHVLFFWAAQVRGTAFRKVDSGLNPSLVTYTQCGLRVSGFTSVDLSFLSSEAAIISLPPRPL